MKLRRLLIENEYEDDVIQLSRELSAVVKSELENNNELEEAIDPASILSYILASNAILGIVSKWAMKIFKKYEFGTGVEAAEKIYNFTHQLEQKFETPIKKVVSMFTNDKKIIDTVSGVLFAVFLLFLGAKAGTEAITALQQKQISASTASTIKSALKGRDITHVVKNIVKKSA